MYRSKAYKNNGCNVPQCNGYPAYKMTLRSLATEKIIKRLSLSKQVGNIEEYNAFLRCIQTLLARFNECASYDVVMTGMLSYTYFTSCIALSTLSKPHCTRAKVPCKSDC